MKNKFGIQNSHSIKLNDLKETSARALWFFYVYEGRCSRRLPRVLSYTLLFSIFSTIVFKMLPPQANPVWSHFDDKEFYSWILRASIFCMSFLIFFVVDIIDQNNKWMREFQDLLSRSDKDHDFTKVAWKYTKIIADRSKVISQIIIYPFIVVLLMLLARISYFENWSIPIPLLIVLGTNFAILFYVGYRLRIKTEDLRHDIIVKLEEQLILQRDTTRIDIINERNENNTNHKNNNTKPYKQLSELDIAQRDHHAAYISSLIHDIRQINYGAFGSLWNQPLIKGAMILVGAMSVTFSEYATMIN